MSAEQDFASLLLGKAGDDYEAFRILSANPKAPAWTLGFHAQQAIEKALKAVLASRSIEYARTHNLDVLCKLIEANGLPVPPDAASLGRLTPYGAFLRYDETGEALESTLDQAWAETLVKQTLLWAKANLPPAS
jgi:HEPN domain-containing protein